MVEYKRNVMDSLRRLYLPGYIVLQNGGDFEENEGFFKVNPVEPPVTIYSDRYLTPRGTHIIASQAGIVLLDYFIRRGSIGLDSSEFLDFAESGRLKIVEFNQRFRREIGLDLELDARFTLEKYRPGRIPLVCINFNLGNRDIVGDIVGVLSPYPVRQTNTDILK